jgi:hypothetical protein
MTPPGLTNGDAQQPFPQNGSPDNCAYRRIRGFDIKHSGSVSDAVDYSGCPARAVSGSDLWNGQRGDAHECGENLVSMKGLR